MESIIKKAIEAGYKPRTKTSVEFVGANDGRMEKDGERTINGWSVWNFTEGNNKGSSICIEHSNTVLDPLFFQALGKACGWEGKIARDENTEPYCSNMVMISCDEPLWEYYALRFHEINLTKGWDKAVEYLAGIIEDK